MTTPGASTGLRAASTRLLDRVPLLRHVANLLGVSVASKFVPVASIFVYSRMMSVPDYGMVNLFASYLWIFAIAMSLNLYTGLGRYVYREDADIGSFLGTTMIALGTLYAIGTLVILAGLDRFAVLLHLSPPLVLLMLVVVLGAIAESVFTQMAIFRRESGLLLRMMAGKAITSFTVGLAALALMPEGSAKYYAVVGADALASAALTAYVLHRLRPDIRWTFRRDHLRYMAHYSLPLIPYMLSLTLLSQFDRVMIDQFFGKAATGLYSLAYNVGTLLLMVVTAVLNAQNPDFFDALNRKDYARLQRDSDGVMALAALATAGLVLFGPALAALVVPAKYFSALDIIPAVAISGFCMTTFQVWVRVLAYAHRTAVISVVATLATVLKIGLNYALLPSMGYKFAAITTAVSYGAMSWLSVVLVNRMVGLFHVSLRRDAVYLALLCAAAWLQTRVELPAALDFVAKVALLAAFFWAIKPRLRLLAGARPAAA